MESAMITPNKLPKLGQRCNGHHLFITFDGLDGTGKTTLSKAVAARLGAQWICTPPHELRASREAVDADFSTDAHFLYYLAGVFETSVRLQNWLEEKAVVCDRYLATTFAYHRAMGSVIAAHLSSAEVVVPDFAFLITASAETRRARMAQRGGMFANDLRTWSIQERISEEYRRFQLLTVDTTGQSIEESVAEVLKFIHPSLPTKSGDFATFLPPISEFR